MTATWRFLRKAKSVKIMSIPGRRLEVFTNKTREVTPTFPLYKSSHEPEASRRRNTRQCHDRNTKCIFDFSLADYQVRPMIHIDRFAASFTSM